MTTLYVSPTGSSGGTGTQSAPFASLQQAYAGAAPGDTIYLRGGTYSFAGASTGWSLSGRSGTKDAPIRIESYPGEKVVLDGAGMALTPGSDNNWPSAGRANGALLSIWNADHVQIRNIEVKNGPLAGIYADGQHHGLVLENVVVHGTGWLDNAFGTGVAIYGTGNDNKFINNKSYANGGYAGNGGNADGFQIFIEGNATGTEIRGNQAWRNTDDGFDFYNVTSVSESASGSRYLVTGNTAFENGFRYDGTMNTSYDANGNGFKLGGRRDGSTGTHGGHTVIDNVSANNKGNGFDENTSGGGSLPFTVIGNVSYDNARNGNGSYGDLGYHYLFMKSADTVFRDNVAFTSDGGRNAVLVEAPGGGTLMASSGNAWNGSGSPVFTQRLTTYDFKEPTEANALSGSLQSPISPVPQPSADPVVAPVLDTATQGSGSLVTDLSGNNKIIGTNAADLLDGGPGADTMVGGAGNDTYRVDETSDVLTELLGGGTDLVEATISYTLKAEFENLTLAGMAATGTGNELANVITGNGLSNILSGGAGNDRLLGLAGSDRLDGGTGDDVLVGGTGRDFLTGGDGRDLFDFNTAYESGRDSTTRDQILDFKRGEDQVDLRTIDANTKVADNQAFKFIGGNAFSNTAGELRINDLGSTVIVQADRNGDGRVDFEVLVRNVGTLSSGDFLL